MKALFIIDYNFKSIIDIPEAIPRYYFAICESRINIIPYEENILLDRPQTKKMVFELWGNETMNIRGKVEYLPVYKFRCFEN